jgi:hypothetical protein
MDKVWCEDCKFVDKRSWGFDPRLWKCNMNPMTPYVGRKDGQYCSQINRHGTCPQFERKTSLLVQIKDFLGG